jgi:hypothetical protein
MLSRVLPLLMVSGIIALADTNALNSTNSPAPLGTVAQHQQGEAAGPSQNAEQIRTRCIEGRRYIAGRVVQVYTNGIVVDSGFSKLLSPPFNRSWLVPGTVSVSRDSSAVEENKPDAICAGLVFLSNIPKRPVVKNYDYVVIHGYPAGTYVYAPVAGVEKTIRRFSASLDRAVDLNLARERK